MQGAKDFFFSSTGRAQAARAMGVENVAMNEPGQSQARTYMKELDSTSNVDKREDTDLADLKKKLMDVFEMAKKANSDIESRSEFNLLNNYFANFISKTSAKGRVTLSKEHLMTMHELGGFAALRLARNLKNAKKEIAVLGTTLHESLLYINNFVEEMKRVKMTKVEAEMLEGQIPRLFMSCDSLDVEEPSKVAKARGEESVRHMFVSVTRNKIRELLKQCENFLECIKQGTFVDDPTLAQRIEAEMDKLNKTLDQADKTPENSDLGLLENFFPKSGDGCCPDLWSMLGMASAMGMGSGMSTGSFAPSTMATSLVGF